MKIANIADMRTFRAGRAVRVGAWHYVDGLEANGDPSVGLRYIYHYGTCMAVLIVSERSAEIGFVPYSVGWGSVSDQGGMNKILAAAGLPLRYRRDAKGGGARYEQVSA